MKGERPLPRGQKRSNYIKGYRYHNGSPRKVKRYSPSVRLHEYDVEHPYKPPTLWGRMARWSKQ